MILLSNPKFHLDNFCLVIKISFENDYSLEFIFNNINKQLININFKRKKRVIISKARGLRDVLCFNVFREI